MNYSSSGYFGADPPEIASTTTVEGGRRVCHCCCEHHDHEQQQQQPVFTLMRLPFEAVDPATDLLRRRRRQQSQLLFSAASAVHMPSMVLLQLVDSFDAGDGRALQLLQARLSGQRLSI